MLGWFNRAMGRGVARTGEAWQLRADEHAAREEWAEAVRCYREAAIHFEAARLNSSIEADRLWWMMQARTCWGHVARCAESAAEDLFVP